MRFFDTSVGLLAHYEEMSAPYWLPDTSLIYLLSKAFSKERSKPPRPISLDKLLDMQYPSGGFPLSIGFADHFDRKLLPSRPRLRRWRDIVPTPNWNSWIFWHLAESLDGHVTLPEPTAAFPHLLASDEEEWEGPYTINDDLRTVSFKRADGTDAALFVKTLDTPLLCRIRERNESFRQQKRMEKYPTLIRKAIVMGADLFGRVN
jgi:hypothetical protein